MEAKHPRHKKPVVIGLIHANWCGHCKNLMPAWEQMRTNIARKPYRPPPQYMEIEHANLGELDRFNAENAANLQNGPIKTDGFPTIFKIGADGNIAYYNDSATHADNIVPPRDPQSMENWFMQNQRIATPHPRAMTTRTYTMVLRPRSTSARSRRHRRKRRSSAASRRGSNKRRLRQTPIV